MSESSSLRDTLVEVGLHLRDQYLSCPNNHCCSEEFKRAYRLAEGISYENFKSPEYFPMRLTEAKLCQDTALRITLFFVPKGCQTSLHDHPSMYVIAKVLKGRLTRSKYALENNNYQRSVPQSYVGASSNEDSQQLFPKVIAKKVTETLTAGQIDLITPEDNLHLFYAEEDSVFMDFIAPDYDNKEIFMNTYTEAEALEDGRVVLQMGPPKLEPNLQMTVDFL